MHPVLGALLHSGTKMAKIRPFNVFIYSVLSLGVSRMALDLQDSRPVSASLRFTCISSWIVSRTLGQSPHC